MEKKLIAGLRFGVYELRIEAGELRKGGSRIRLREQPFRLLLTLIEHAGLVVTRDQIRHRLWPDGPFVDFDRAINKAVSELRDVLGDSASDPRFVETLSKRGYRFVHSVERAPPRALSDKEGDLQSDAHVACTIARYLWNRRTVADLESSLRYFESGIEAESRCAIAHAGLADANLVLGIWGVRTPDTAFDLARRAAIRALELDPNLADAHTSLAEVFKDYDWNWELAERHYRHALSLNPAYATAHQWYAQLLVTLGRYPEAVWHIEKARRADPVSPAINAYLPYVYLAGRQQARALREARRAVSLEPYSPLAHWQLGRAYLFSGQEQHAVVALNRAAALAPSATMWEAELCFAYARAGDRTAAMQLLSALVDRAQHHYVSPYDLAIAFAGVGDGTSALDYLEQAVDQRVMRILSVGDPEFDDLRADPRFARLTTRLCLPGAPITSAPRSSNFSA